MAIFIARTGTRKLQMIDKEWAIELLCLSRYGCAAWMRAWSDSRWCCQLQDTFTVHHGNFYCSFSFWLNWKDILDVVSTICLHFVLGSISEGSYYRPIPYKNKKIDVFTNLIPYLLESERLFVCELWRKPHPSKDLCPNLPRSTSWGGINEIYRPKRVACMEPK